MTMPPCIWSSCLSCRVIRYELHLRTLAAIARLFHDNEMKRQLLEDGTAHEMLLTLQRRAPRAVAA